MLCETKWIVLVRLTIIAKLISKVVEKTTKNIILNADDRRVSAMTTDTGASIEYFGVSPNYVICIETMMNYTVVYQI